MAPADDDHNPFIGTMVKADLVAKVTEIGITKNQAAQVVDCVLGTSERFIEGVIDAELDVPEVAFGLSQRAEITIRIYDFTATLVATVASKLEARGYEGTVFHIDAEYWAAELVGFGSFLLEEIVTSVGITEAKAKAAVVALFGSIKDALDSNGDKVRLVCFRGCCEEF